MDNDDTLESIRVRGGQRGERYGKPIEEITPTTNKSPFYAGGFFAPPNGKV
jgi:hypothetical protein